MKHLIIGTAGHIDHGKTTLIKALTGRNTDRLKEEQERGISIELGFTYFDLPGGQRAGIIDVPGHEKFIRNMLAGVIGIDIVLLVVAADEGIMPQTAEHLAILDLVGVKSGFVVITKSDLVDDEWLQLVEEEIKDEVKGTFLEGASIIPVSSTEKRGISNVIEEVLKLSETLEDKSLDDMPRLPVDRVFTISGFGTVVTGTLLAGNLKVGDEIQVYPGDTIARIRSIQVHDQDASVAYGGQRVALNLAGVKKSQIDRGSIVAPVNSMRSTMMLDVKIKLLRSLNKGLENRTRLKLYLGTDEILCRVVLLDREVLEPGDETYAQLRLEEETVAKRGDRFILRFYSPMFTVGGGEVLEPNPVKRKRFDEESLEELTIKDQGNFSEIVEHIVEENSRNYHSLKEISKTASMLEESLEEEIKKLEGNGKVIIFRLSKDIYPVHKKVLNLLENQIIGELEDFHRKYPIRNGMAKEELRSRFLSKAKPKLAEEILDHLITGGRIKQLKDLVALSVFEPELNDKQLALKKWILDSFEKAPFMPPKREDLQETTLGTNGETEEMIMYLIGSGELVKLSDDLYLLPSSLEKAKSSLYDLMAETGNITVGGYRDILNTNRKVAIGLLEYFDQIKLTRRSGENRVLFK